MSNERSLREMQDGYDRQAAIDHARHSTRELVNRRPTRTNIMFWHTYVKTIRSMMDDIERRLNEARKAAGAEDE